MESRRKQWAHRVAGWRRSGQTAKAYARLIGVNAGTLTHWAWRLGHDQRRPHAAKLGSMIEVVGAGVPGDRFELQLPTGHRVHVPSGFDASALRRLIAVLEEQS